MKAKKRQPVLRINDKRSGELLYIGKFYFEDEFPDVQFPIKRRLIYERDLFIKQTSRGEARRSGKEQENLLEELYEQKKQEILDGLRTEKDKANTESFEVLFDLWIQNARSLKFSERTIKDHYIQVKKAWLRIFPGKRLDQFKPEDLIDFRTALGQPQRRLDKKGKPAFDKDGNPAFRKKLKISSINSRLKTLQAFFNWLFDIEEIHRPVKVKRIAERDREPEILTQDQINQLYNRLLEKASSRYPDHFIALIRFFWLDYYTGARRNGILFAKRENFYLDESVWIIEDEDPDESEEIDRQFRIKEKVVKKAIPLAEPLKAFLETDLNRGDVYYIGDHPTEERPIYTETGISQAFRRQMDGLGFPKVVKPAHFWRAKLPSDLLNRYKIPLEVASKVLNHSSPAVTAKHYLKMQVDSLLSAVNSIEEFDTEGNFLEVIKQKN
jgi:integrase